MVGREHVCTVLDLDFNVVKTHRYSMTGWGLTHDSKRLILSDGSDKLFFLDAESFQVPGHQRYRS